MVLTRIHKKINISGLTQIPVVRIIKQVPYYKNELMSPVFSKKMTSLKLHLKYIPKYVIKVRYLNNFTKIINNTAFLKNNYCSVNNYYFV